MTKADGAAAVASVLIVTYNSRAVIGECVAPLVADPHLEVLVFDNASSDGTVEYLRDVFGLNAIASPSNLGFARAVNQLAASAHSTVLVLLNPDARISAPAVKELAAQAQTSGDIVAPFIDHPDTSIRVAAAGYFPTCRRVLLQYTGLAWLLSRTLGGVHGLYIYPHQIESQPIDWVSGACLAISRSDWRRLGGLTERWFMYAEDIDLCYRAARAGIGVRVAPQIRASHVMGGSSSGEPAPSSATWWATNLTEFFDIALARNGIHSLLFRLCFGGGLLAREMLERITRLIKPRRPRSRTDFGTCGRAVLLLPVARSLR